MGGHRGRRGAVLATARALLRYGPPTVGVFVIGQAVIDSIGGYIYHWRFVIGVALILAGFSAGLLPKR